VIFAKEVVTLGICRASCFIWRCDIGVDLMDSKTGLIYPWVAAWWGMVNDRKWNMALSYLEFMLIWLA
jgi:hypothetical protein